MFTLLGLWGTHAYPSERIDHFKLKQITRVSFDFDSRRALPKIETRIVGISLRIQT